MLGYECRLPATVTTECFKPRTLDLLLRILVFFSVLLGTRRTSTFIWPWLLRSTFFPIHYSLTVLTYMYICVCLYGGSPPSQFSSPKFPVLCVFYNRFPFFSYLCDAIPQWPRTSSPLSHPAGTHGWILLAVSLGALSSNARTILVS
jgi:hypothetical protein